MVKELELETGEFVVRATRKHWLLFVLELFPFIILFILPFALPTALPYVPFKVDFSLSESVGRAVLGIWFLLIWTAAWGAFTRYFLNAWILTNFRIVNIKQHSFWHRSISSLMLPRVQDVTTNISGIIFSLLKIGNIKVQSAGEEVEFVMAGIPHPEQMRDLILKFVPDSPPRDGV